MGYINALCGYFTPAFVGLAVPAVLAATPALAQKELWSCFLDRRCNENGCEVASSRFTVQLNTASGAALITYADQGSYQSEFNARVLTQSDIRHIVFDNGTGIEVTTMMQAGPAMMSGHMIWNDVLSGEKLIFYRLEGTCTHEQ